MCGVCQVHVADVKYQGREEGATAEGPPATAVGGNTAV